MALILLVIINNSNVSQQRRQEEQRLAEEGDAGSEAAGIGSCLDSTNTTQHHDQVCAALPTYSLCRACIKQLFISMTYWYESTACFLAHNGLCVDTQA